MIPNRCLTVGAFFKTAHSSPQGLQLPAGLAVPPEPAGLCRFLQGSQVPAGTAGPCRFLQASQDRAGSAGSCKSLQGLQVPAGLTGSCRNCRSREQHVPLPEISMCAHTTVCMSLHDMGWPAPLVTATHPHAMAALCQALTMLHSLNSTYHPPTLLQHHCPLHPWFHRRKHPSPGAHARCFVSFRGTVPQPSPAHTTEHAARPSHGPRMQKSSQASLAQLARA